MLLRAALVLCLGLRLRPPCAAGVGAAGVGADLKEVEKVENNYDADFTDSQEDPNSHNPNTREDPNHEGNESEAQEVEELQRACPQLSGQIVGGRASSIARHPYQVSMVINGNSFCGGFIVSPDYVLTAAHCVQNASAARIRLRVGSTRRDAGGRVVRVAGVAVHPRYGRPRFDSDVAVLRLARALPPSRSARALRLPRARQPLPRAALTVTGWGLTAPRGRRIPVALREARVPVVPRWLCALSYGGALTANMFCGGHFLIGGVSSCQVYEMFLRGYRFRVLSPTFTIHWGLQSRRHRPLWRERQNQANRRLFETFKRELYARYRKDPLHLISKPRPAKKT